jgi:hypothetical protein
MIQNIANDFGTLYRSAFAERDPEKKQILLSQVQQAISDSEQERTASTIKLAAQSASESKITAVA